MSDIQAVRYGRSTHRSSRVVWGIQIVLALLFLFAGGMKLAMPAAVLAHLSGLPGAFMKFIGAAEVSGALGLVLPGLFRIQRRLTPLAAVGLVTIMSGATVVTLETGQIAGAIVPLVVGILAAQVARRRWEWIAPAASGAAPAVEARRARPVADVRPAAA
jgi:DoxX-like protein